MRRLARLLETIRGVPSGRVPPLADALTPDWRWSVQVDWEQDTWRMIVDNTKAWITKANVEAHTIDEMAGSGSGIGD